MIHEPLKCTIDELSEYILFKYVLKMKSSQSSLKKRKELSFYLSYYKSFINMTYQMNLAIQVFIKPA